MMTAKSVENSKEGALHLIKKSLERLVSNPTTLFCDKTLERVK